MSGTDKRNSKEAGFTLVEVLVSFLILSLGLTVLFQAFTVSSKGMARIEERQVALALAGSLYDRIGADIALMPGKREGDFEIDGFAWKLDVTTSELVKGPDRKRRGLFPYKVRGEVIDEDGERVLAEFETVRLGRQ